jgi:hypothetical protein
MSEALSFAESRRQKKIVGISQYAYFGRRDNKDQMIRP